MAEVKKCNLLGHSFCAPLHAINLNHCRCLLRRRSIHLAATYHSRQRRPSNLRCRCRQPIIVIAHCRLSSTPSKRWLNSTVNSNLSTTTTWWIKNEPKSLLYKWLPRTFPCAFNVSACCWLLLYLSQTVLTCFHFITVDFITKPLNVILIITLPHKLSQHLVMVRLLNAGNLDQKCAFPRKYTPCTTHRLASSLVLNIHKVSLRIMLLNLNDTEVKISKTSANRLFCYSWARDKRYLSAKTSLKSIAESYFFLSVSRFNRQSLFTNHLYLGYATEHQKPKALLAKFWD